ICVRSRTRLAVAVQRDVVVGDERVAVGRRFEVMRAGTGDVELDRVAVVQIGERLQQRRFNQWKWVDVVGGVDGDDGSFSGKTEQGECRDGKKQRQFFHESQSSTTTQRFRYIPSLAPIARPAGQGASLRGRRRLESVRRVARTE